MALPSGVYIIENVHSRNWAILTNDNDGDDVLSGTDADTDSGHKWEIRELHNGTYLLRNQQFHNHASYKITDDIGDQSSVLSIRTGDPKRWHINRFNEVYWISDLDGSRCWTLRYNHPETPIMLEKYTRSNYQHWKIIPESEAHTLRTRASESVATRPISDKSPPTLRECPPPTSIFTGRQDILLEMHEYFSSDIGKRHVAVLIGLGGVGKSQLTLKFIEECQIDTRFSEVFFIDATSSETINDDLRKIALVKGTGDSSKDGLQWLSRQNGEWLLFFDHADDITLNLLDYFPRSSNGNIIVTTRNNEARIHAPRSNWKIPGLAHDDAKILLLDIAGVKDPSDETISLAGTIVKELGNLALAINQAGAYISKTGCSLHRYIEMYRERRTEFLEEYRDNVQKIDDYEWTVYTTWTVSFEKLSARAAMFLNICSFLHRDGISAEMFQRASSNTTARILEGQRLAGFNIAQDFLASFRSRMGHWDLHKFLKIMTEIRSYSLIDFDERNETYSIHPLVHAWTHSRVSDATSIHECSQYILSMSIDEEYGSKDIAFRRTLLPHIDASLRGGVANDPNVLGWLWCPYYEGGRWKEAEKLVVIAIEATKRVIGEEHPNTLSCMANLAVMYRDQGRLKDAEELGARVLEMRERVLGEEHPRTLKSVTELASIYWSQGRWKDAEELGMRVMEVSIRVLGEAHPDTLLSMADLAVTFLNEGRLKDAEELGVRVVEIRKRVLGEKHPDTLVSIGNLAATYSNQGRLEEAEELEIQVMEMRKQVLGDEHPDTLFSMANLAVTYSKRSRLSDAEELGVQVMERSKRVLGEGHPNTLRTMANLAVVYLKQGRRKDAEQLLVQVVQLSKRVLGEDHPDTLKRMADLASMDSLPTESLWNKVLKWTRWASHE